MSKGKDFNNSYRGRRNSKDTETIGDYVAQGLISVGEKIHGTIYNNDDESLVFASSLQESARDLLEPEEE